MEIKFTVTDLSKLGKEGNHIFLTCSCSRIKKIDLISVY